jgi:pyrroloquinoline-quinone synthase
MDPPMAGGDFIRFLHQEKARKYPDPPELYQRLRSGSLDRDGLQLWVKDMYSYWDNLYHSTSAIYVKTNVESLRQNMLRKLVEIEGEEIIHDITGATTPAYEELWLRFGEGIGLRREEITSWKPFTRTYYAITTLFMYSRWWEWTWLDGIASLYAGDLFGHEQMSACYEALQTRYEVPDESLEFFRVYLRHAATHFDWEEDALSYWCCTRERQLTAARAFRERLDIEDQMLVAVNQSVATGMMPALSP